MGKFVTWLRVGNFTVPVLAFLLLNMLWEVLDALNDLEVANIQFDVGYRAQVLLLALALALDAIRLGVARRYGRQPSSPGVVIVGIVLGVAGLGIGIALSLGALFAMSGTEGGAWAWLGACTAIGAAILVYSLGSLWFGQERLDVLVGAVVLGIVAGMIAGGAAWKDIGVPRGYLIAFAAVSPGFLVAGLAGLPAERVFNRIDKFLP